ncbi:MAG: hypothetical protein BJ554DRAFT_5257 [Olpidium bornovanus]|uniref:AP complex mu/sigma subunit domain-containing protein n=1 Tax=Olpidium bornovanus TaxID=278681 RepID=A0A8H7ZZG6_9FUNG|nr:MAG: hypothetical protein BJ554DRAFT_5257 [Olpidium bornovanus]
MPRLVLTASSSFYRPFQINYVLLVSRQGKVRLTKWFQTISPKEKAKIVKEVTQAVLARRTRMCNVLEYKGAIPFLLLPLGQPWERTKDGFGRPSPGPGGWGTRQGVRFLVGGQSSKGLQETRCVTCPSVGLREAALCPHLVICLPCVVRS